MLRNFQFDGFSAEYDAFASCNCCPRECRVNRAQGELGWCRTDQTMNVASIIPHFGEEPVISGTKGICNVFFGHCNLQCIYCQNHQISLNTNDIAFRFNDLDTVIGEILKVLAAGCGAVGFVSPSHVIPQLRHILKTLDVLDVKVPRVYNSSAYDQLAEIRKLEGMIDVYLPDLKYMDENLAARLSKAGDYPAVSKKVLKEMYRQKGSTLVVDTRGYACSGLIIRHLVLPGQVQNSIDVLRFIAEELSPSVHISLMSQYHPLPQLAGMPPFNRGILAEEYNMVLEALEHLGFYRGWVQELDSADQYLPDFNRENPFGEC